MPAAPRIRDAPGPNQHTPIVALTANALAEHRAQWSAVGVTLFAAKPVNMETLIGVVAQAIDTAPARQATPARLAHA